MIIIKKENYILHATFFFLCKCTVILQYPLMCRPSQLMQEGISTTRGQHMLFYKPHKQCVVCYTFDQ